MHDVEDTVEQPETEDYSVEEYEKAKSVKFPVLIAKVDCVAHHMFCMQQRVQGYPTLSLFVNGERYKVCTCTCTVDDLCCLCVFDLSVGM
jgi:hypothetical protein